MAATTTVAPQFDRTTFQAAAAASAAATPPLRPSGSAQSSGTYNETAVADSVRHSQKCAGNEHSPSSTHTLAPGSHHHHQNYQQQHQQQNYQQQQHHRRGRSKKATESGPACGAGLAQEEPEETEAAEGAAVAVVSDRCSTHPGSRNDLWCDTCQAAVCSHCAGGAGHRTHAVATLASAYDDAYEEVEAEQLTLLRHLGETRARNAALDAAGEALADDYGAALAALDAQLARDTERVEALRAEAEAALERRGDECAQWREALEGAVDAVQRMVEDLAPAQAVTERARMLRMLRGAAQARPAAWGEEPLQGAESLLAASVAPGWHYAAALRVAAVAELGRRRGHVHVVGARFAAHGAVWQARVSRSRTAVGEPSLALAVACVEGGAERRAFSVAARVAGLGAAAGLKTHAGEWAQGSEHVFTLCLLDAVAPALDADGALEVRVGVRAESFRELALAQAARIAVLEARVAALSSTPESAHSEPPRRGMLLAAPPQIPLPDPPVIPNASESAKLRRQAPIPFPISIPTLSPSPPPIPAFMSSPPGSTHSQSSSSGLGDDRGVLRRLSGWMRTTGRQSRLNQHNQQSLLRVAGGVPTSARDGDDGDGEADGDWTFLDRTLSPGFEQSTAALTMTSSLALSSSASASSSRLGRRPLSLWPSRGLINASPPLPALPPQPPLPINKSPVVVTGDDVVVADDDVAAGFAFDGRADIEREQARVDAAAAGRRRLRLRREQAALDLEARCSSLAQRVDKIQLIANTCENARDGFSSAAAGGGALLRRISSELGVLAGSSGAAHHYHRRRPQLYSAAPLSPPPPPAAEKTSDDEGGDGRRGSSPSPRRHPRRAVTMDSHALGRVLENVSYESNAYESNAYENSAYESNAYEVRRCGVAVTRRTSSSSVSSMSSAGGGGGSGGGRRITRPGGGSSSGRRLRRDSGAEATALLGLTAAAAAAAAASTVAASKLGGAASSSSPAQLTPRANRQGGILKAGRTMRAKRLAPVAEADAPRSADDAGAVGVPATRVARSLSNAAEDDDALAQQQQQHQQLRMARAPRAPLVRKAVRFPEELRLLETIRLIDPRAAQTIESRVTSVHEPSAPLLPLLRSASVSSSDDEVEESALAARVRSSPRLAPRPPPPPPPPPFSSSSSSPPLHSLPHSLPATRAGGDPLNLRYERPPPLPSTQQQQPRSSGARIIDDDAPFGCVRRRRSSCSSNSSSDGCRVVQGRAPDSSLSFAVVDEAAAVAAAVAKSRRSALLLHVGPNVASAQSSPMSALSESSAELLLVAGATHSAHLYPPRDLAAFGDAQIPAIACGRDTAFRASEHNHRHHHQGADCQPYSILKDDD